ncbi:MAG: lytic transglycosylase domain-containing protein [Methylobacteriaceae bacterium]|nr:lytic transglycosylase domain-containing protein [Methylobacteriaceae bacterium]
MTKDSGAQNRAQHSWKRKTVGATVLAAGCLAPVTLGHIDLIQRLRPSPAQSVRLEIPLPPEQTFVFDPQDDRHAEFAQRERPQPLETTASADATAAIARAAPQAPRSMQLDPPLVSAYARAVDPVYPTGVVDPAAGLGVELTGLREGLDAYRHGDIAKGDAAAATAKDPLVVTTLEWAAIRLRPLEVGHRRIARFMASHPDWPAMEWLRKHAELALYAAKPPAPAVIEAFRANAPTTPAGRVALAAALLDEGETARANDLARKIWRDDALNMSQEGALKKKFGGALTPVDSARRASRLAYDEKFSAALRAASLAGPDIVALTQIRAAAERGIATDKTFADAPPAVKVDAGLAFAKIKYLLHQKKYAEAGALMLTAPRDPAAVVDGDAWWEERRNLARKLLDAGDALTAYKICAGHAAEANDKQIEAEFHAGWIALRYLDKPNLAAPHFDTAMKIAHTPISRARAAYWRGRAAEAAKDDAASFYEQAAAESATFYGQLARLRLGRSDTPIRFAPLPAEGVARAESVRAIELLYAAGAKDIAVPLAYLAAKSIEAPEQMAALASVVVKDSDAKVSLTFGKLAAQNGHPIDDVAFPTYGVPQFSPFENSASLPVVYSIARQESAFDPKAVSHAGAMGLMQMIASTARSTARRVGVAFEARRMTADPVFNAQLGAAHLGDLLKEQRNSLILTFAAYNAGGRRVKEWIAAHGDPRDASVDPIDWIERIPIAETRNYVQRVLENLTIYRARLGMAEAKAIEPLRKEARM